MKSLVRLPAGGNPFDSDIYETGSACLQILLLFYPIDQKLEMPWLFTIASSFMPALHIGHSREE